jgi:hypothetical protein
MINKENDDKEQKPVVKEDEGILDVANMTVQCHLMIKDKDTGKVLLNKRG